MLYLSRFSTELVRDELRLSGEYCACIVQSLTDDSRLDSKFKKHVISIFIKYKKNAI